MDKNIDKRMMEGIKLAELGFYSYLFDGTVLSFDQVTYDFFELGDMYEGPGSVIGQKIESLFVYTGQKGRIRNEIKAHKSVSRMEYGLKTLKGKEKWGIHNSYLYTDEKTGQDAIQVCFYDITDVKKQEEERLQLESRLHQSEKIQAIGQLAGGIAHDFNNQLTGIIGFADLLKYELKNDYRLSHYVDNILIAARHSADLTGKLLAFARKGKYLSVEVDIHRTIMEVISLLQHSIDKRISLQQIFKAHPPVTSGDPAQLQNALLNLALNSRDAMPNGGSLTFETRITDLDAAYCGTRTENIRPGRYIEITVTDTGIGMTEETKKRMFEPFFTTKEVGKGTGMGLAAVYGTVKNHKGTIEVQSETGRGTSVSIYLPVAARKCEIKEEKISASAEPGRKLNFLLVDDEEIVCRLGKEMLELKGHSVCVHSDSREAVELFRKNRDKIDLVILDMVMPYMNGTDTFTVLKEIDPEVKILLSSGYSITGEAQELLKKGAAGFIKKLFSVDDLTKSIAEIFPY